MAAPAKIPFNVPYTTRGEVVYIRDLIKSKRLSSVSAYTKRCERWLEERLGSRRALLTPSCTAALEMAVLLSDIGPGDEIIMPSFTFVSMANAVALRGGIPVFVDIRADTLNLDESLIEGAIGPRTKAIMPMHYGGVSCAMDKIMPIAEARGLTVIEDAAHAILADYEGRPLGTAGPFAALSFHETKNVVCGEGGALLINDESFIERAEIIREKGTNRLAFYRRKVDQYSWQDLGSSYVPSELAAAFLAAQLEKADLITRRRRGIWQAYHEGLADLEVAGLLRRPVVPDRCRHNGHLYYVLLADGARRQEVIDRLKSRGITAPFHYVPLHSAPAARRFAKTVGPLPVTEDAASRLLRLPIWLGMEGQVPRIIKALRRALTET